MDGTDSSIVFGNRAHIIKQMKIEYFKRNNSLIADGLGYRKPARKNEINLNWWHIDYNSAVQNSGDWISEIVFNYMCQYYGLNPGKRVKKTRHLYAIGSILFFENQDATVWGTGAIAEQPMNISTLIHQKWMRRLDVRAVRGPKTREQLLNIGIRCPEIYGDPAVIMPLVYTPQKKKKSPYTLVISHYRDNRELSRECADTLCINMLGEKWEEKIDLIASADRVISSSLHGVILAEAYGVPAFLLKPTPEFNLFKYEDYYLGTGRTHLPVVSCVEEGLQSVVQIEQPDIPAIQQRLINSFPKDLWE